MHCLEQFWVRMLNEASNGFEFSVSISSARNISLFIAPGSYKILRRHSWVAGRYKGTFSFLFWMKIYICPIWILTSNNKKCLSRHKRKGISWFPSKIKSIINSINCKRFHFHIIEIRKTSLSRFCNTFLRSVWTLKRREFAERINVGYSYISISVPGTTHTVVVWSFVWHSADWTDPRSAPRLE